MDLAPVGDFAALSNRVKFTAVRQPDVQIQTDRGGSQMRKTRILARPGDGIPLIYCNGITDRAAGNWRPDEGYVPRFWYLVVKPPVLVAWELINV